MPSSTDCSPAYPPGIQNEFDIAIKLFLLLVRKNEVHLERDRAMLTAACETRPTSQIMFPCCEKSISSPNRNGRVSGIRNLSAPGVQRFPVLSSRELIHGIAAQHSYTCQLGTSQQCLIQCPARKRERSTRQTCLPENLAADEANRVNGLRSQGERIDTDAPKKGQAFGTQKFSADLVLGLSALLNEDSFSFPLVQARSQEPIQPAHHQRSVRHERVRHSSRLAP